MKKKVVFIMMYLVMFISFISCKKEEVKAKVERSFLYIILDKSSASYSVNGGFEENYIDIDTTYLNNLISDLFYNPKRSAMKQEIVVWFNYVDLSSEGNKEVFLKIPVIPVIDTVYVPKPGEIMSNKESFKKEVRRLQAEKEKLITNFLDIKRKKLRELDVLLKKSKVTKGSDCKGLIEKANNKLNHILIDTTNFTRGKSIIVTFSDMVNYPRKTKKIEINNLILRPGFTSPIPYIEGDIVNFSNDEEFKDYLLSYLKIN